MAFQKGYVEISVEVLPAPGCFLAADPLLRRVPKGDPAVFDLAIQRLNDFIGPVYLQVQGIVNGSTITPNPIPPGETTARLEIEANWDEGLPPMIFGVEASDVPYPPDET